MKFKITGIKSNGTVKRWQKGNWRRLGQVFEAKLFQKWVVYVNYGKFKDNFGKITEFINEGEYTDGRKARRAFKAFIDG